MLWIHAVTFRRLVCINLTYRKQDKIVRLAAHFVPRIPIPAWSHWSRHTQGSYIILQLKLFVIMIYANLKNSLWCLFQLLWESNDSWSQDFSFSEYVTISTVNCKIRQQQGSWEHIHQKISFELDSRVIPLTITFELAIDVRKGIQGFG